MPDDFLQQPEKLGWRFPRPFWIANAAELFERAAYYGVMIVLSVYLTEQIGFTDVWTGYVGGAFASVLYLLPTFTGIMADKIGFRRALLLAFALLTVGYALLGVAGTRLGEPLLAEVPRKLTAVAALAIIMFGGSIIKPVITGTAAVCSDEAHRARAFSIFYAVVNIGAFTGKSVAAPVRQHLGLEYIDFCSAAMALAALGFVALFYRNVTTAGTGKNLAQAWQGLRKVLSNFRFMALILIVAGFWAIQHQLYASMPKYILRLLGDSAKPEWLANVNPFVVVLLVIPITHLVRRLSPVNSIAIALFIIPISSLVISLSPWLQGAFGNSVPVFFGWRLHPVTLMVILGIGLQGLAECFLSPKFLEFASKQAPPGEVGLYMGYMHLSSCFAYLFGFIISGYLLDWYCPDPKQTLSPELYAQWQAAVTTGGPLPQAYARAHYIWYVFGGIGASALAALWIFKFVTAALDRRRAAAVRV